MGASSVSLITDTTFFCVDGNWQGLDNVVVLTATRIGHSVIQVCIVEPLYNDLRGNLSKQDTFSHPKYHSFNL